MLQSPIISSEHSEGICTLCWEICRVQYGRSSLKQEPSPIWFAMQVRPFVHRALNLSNYNGIFWETTLTPKPQQGFYLSLISSSTTSKLLSRRLKTELQKNLWKPRKHWLNTRHAGVLTQSQPYVRRSFLGSWCEKTSKTKRPFRKQCHILNWKKWLTFSSTYFPQDSIKFHKTTKVREKSTPCCVVTPKSDGFSETQWESYHPHSQNDVHFWWRWRRRKTEQLAPCNYTSAQTQVMAISLRSAPHQNIPKISLEKCNISSSLYSVYIFKKRSLMFKNNLLGLTNDSVKAKFQKQKHLKWALKY